MATGFFFFLCSTILLFLHGHADTKGFISIDCGMAANSSYTDTITGITYVSDEQYIDTGTNTKISPSYMTQPLVTTQSSTLRTFPDGDRNCYTLKPVNIGSKYLIRAMFMYGDYDGVNKTSNDKIKFDLYVGADLWENVGLSSSLITYEFELVTIAMADYFSVCLVKNGSDIPFISALELRPMKNTLYSAVNETVSLRLFYRMSLGLPKNSLIRYPDDKYDRIWVPFNSATWIPRSTKATIKYANSDIYEAPQAVLRTAVQPQNNTLLSIFWSDLAGTQSPPVYHLSFHCVEFTAAAFRSFTILLNDKKWFGPFSPSYLLDDYVYTTSPFVGKGVNNFSFVPTANSTLPPILNAMEIYLFHDRGLATNDSDVSAINAVKKHFQVKRNWMGDPCLPTSFIWNGLNCSSSNPPRITNLDLSSSGLSGPIPSILAELSELKYLDFSNNNLTGEIPDALGRLSSLQFLNLSGNHLNGSVLQALLDRSAKGLLVMSLNLDDGSNLCNGYACEEKKKQKKIATPVIVTLVAVPALLLLTVVIVVWRIKRRSQGPNVRPHDEHQFSQPVSTAVASLSSESNRSFTFLELKKMTNNFKHTIGKGGFGSVFLGYLENDAQVAVKMRSQSSSQGAKEFLAEAQLLTRVHHRNLVSLVGYCKDENYLALVYEYMSQGSLQDHLRGKTGNFTSLNWKERLRIALEAAQGLDYLHKGCKPPIVHRDVKTSNILLTEKLEAKLADFGLSKTFQNDSATHISTAVAGTLGYLDPEYHGTYQLTEKSDVYSFGVVLLELITAQPAIVKGVENCHLSDWVKQRLNRGDIAQVVDPRMPEDYDVNSMWKVVDVAMMCTIKESHQRATMGDVVQQLKEALDQQIAYEKPRGHVNSVDMDNSRSFVMDRPSLR